MTDVAHLVGSADPGSDVWLKYMTASKVSALLGLSTYDSPFSLYHRMTGTLPAQPDNELMQRGHYLEPAIANWLADQHPDWTITPTGMWASTTVPWQAATPDRIADTPDGRMVVECKSAFVAHEWGDELTDEIPPGYRAQTMWQLDTLGLDTAVVAVLLSGLEFREYRVAYDADEANWIRTRAETFMGQVRNRQAPPIDGHPVTYSTVRALHPGIQPVEVEIRPSLANRYLDAQAAYRVAKTEKLHATSLVCDAIGSAQHATFGDRTIATRMAKRGGHPYLKFNPNHQRSAA